MREIDLRRVHIYKDPTDHKWHVDMLRDGVCVPTPNVLIWGTYEPARYFVARHMDGHARRHQHD
jgi:hypothetical protein